jgi:hypothetical protein
VGGYDTRVEPPSPDEVLRAAKATFLGAALGLLLLLLAGRARRS